jgi:hypothetical protein
LHQVFCGVETAGCPFQAAVSFDEYGVGTVDQDVRNGIVFEQRLKRPQPHDFVENLVNQTVPFGPVQGELAVLNGVGQTSTKPYFQLFPRRLAHLFKIERTDQFFVEVRFDSRKVFGSGTFFRSTLLGISNED